MKKLKPELLSISYILFLLILSGYLFYSSSILEFILGFLNFILFILRVEEHRNKKIKFHGGEMLMVLAFIFLGFNIIFNLELDILNYISLFLVFFSLFFRKISSKIQKTFFNIKD
jgi:hypothetical protein